MASRRHRAVVLSHISGAGLTALVGTAAAQVQVHGTMAEKLPVVGNTSSCVLGMSHRF